MTKKTTGKTKIKNKNDYKTFSLAPEEFRKIKKDLPDKEYEKLINLLVALARSSQFLAMEKNLKSILTRIAVTIGEALNAKYVNFWDFTPDKKAAYILAAYGMQEQYITHSRKDPLRLGSAWIGRAMKTGKAWATSNVQKDPLLPKSWLPAAKKQNYHGLLCMPLKIKDRIIGGMCIYYKDVHEFESLEMTIATIVANQAATAVENTRIIEDLESEKNKTSSIIRSLNDGLVMYNLAGEVVYFNPKASELLWIETKDIIGKKINENFSKKGQYHKNLYNIKQMTQRDFEIKEYETKGDRKVVLEVLSIPVRDAKNHKIGQMQVLRDITKSKEVELLKSSFVSVASHQLRTPLSQIKWALNSVKNEEDGGLNKGQKEKLEKVFEANEHLIRLVADLLDVSRIEEGRFGYEFKEKELYPIVKNVLKDIKSKAQQKGISVDLAKPDKKMQKISADAGKLELSITNVIDNAIKYSKKGGTVKIYIKSGPKSVMLFIEDNGIGIPAEDQEHIFTKFFRAKNAVRFETEGSGLGLYIAKNAAEKHNALLYFESKENKGSTFVFQFPTTPERKPKGTIEGV